MKTMSRSQTVLRAFNSGILADTNQNPDALDRIMLNKAPQEPSDNEGEGHDDATEHEHEDGEGDDHEGEGDEFDHENTDQHATIQEHHDEETSEIPE